MGENKLDATKSEIRNVNINNSYEQLDKNIDQVATNKHHMDVKAFIGQLFNTLEIGRNAQKLIKPNFDYVVKFTPELLKKIQEHDMQFLKDKMTGELLPDLYDYTEKGIGGKIRLEIKGKPTGQDIAALSNAVNNLIEQQRYEALVEEIQQIHVVAKRIERGQDNDRFAKVNAGRKHFIDALNYQGTEEEKKKLVFDALAMLREGRELIEKILIDKMNVLEKVPEGKLKRLWVCFRNPGYFEEQTGMYDDIQEYFQYYYMSIQPMAYAYTYLQQPQLIEGLLEDSQKVFEHKNIGCLSSIESLRPNDNFEAVWYKNSKVHEQRLLEVYKARNRDENLYITVKGYEILEVLDNGREE